MANKTPKLHKSLSNNTLVVTMMLIAVVMLVVGFIVSRAIFKTISFNNRVISEKRQVESKLKTNVKNLGTIMGNYEVFEETGAGSDVVLKALPTEVDIPALLTRLEFMFNSSGVSFGGFSIEGAENVLAGGETELSSETPLEATVTISISGPYANIKQALSNIENEIAPYKVKTLGISGNDREASAQITFVMNFLGAKSVDIEKVELK